MIIKKFFGKTKEEAMENARAELGDNFIVMNEKSEVRQKGFFSFLKPKLTEITVAKEEDEEINAPKNDRPDTLSKSEADSIRETIASVDKLRLLAEQSEKTVIPPTVDIAVSDDKKTAAEATSKDQTKNAEIKKEEVKKEEVKKDNSSSDSVKPASSKPATYSKPVFVKENKTPDISETISGVQSRDMIDFLRLLYNTMTDNEVSEKYANQVIDEVTRTFNEDMQMEYILSTIYQKMVLKFGKNECIEPSKSRAPKVVIFIGPTGVGKTTTLAKLASYFKLMENKNVAMITADTYRIAATEQLKTYANILGTPFNIIYNLEDLEKNFEQNKQYKDYDFIFVDTAGHSHHNEEQKKDISDYIKFFEGKAEVDVYLVLSATTKYRDLLSIADAYKTVADYKLIFTKLDETDVYGNLLNLKIHTGAPMSYVTCGQNVPDDIEKFSPQNIVKKLLGGDNLGGDK